MAAATPAGVAAEDAQALVAVLDPLSKDATRTTFELYARAVVKASSREADYLHLPPTSSSSGPAAQTAPPPETVLTLFEALMSACKQPFDSELLRKQLHSALRNALKESGLGWPRSGAKSFFYSYDGVICEDFGNHLRALALRDPANQSDLDDMESLLRGTALHARKRSILDLLSRAKLSFQPVMRPRGWRRSAASADGQQQQEQPPPLNGGEPSSPSAPPASSGGGAQDGAPDEGAPAGEATAPAAATPGAQAAARPMPSGSKILHRGRITADHFDSLTGEARTESHVFYLAKTDTNRSSFKKHCDDPYSHVQMISGNGSGGVAGMAVFKLERWSEVPLSSMPEDARTRDVRKIAESSSFPYEVFSITIGERYALPPPNVEDNTRSEEAARTSRRSEEPAPSPMQPPPPRQLAVLNPSVEQAANMRRLVTEAAGVILDPERRETMRIFCEAVRQGTTNPMYIKFAALLALAEGIEASPMLSVTLLTAATPSRAAGATSSSTEVEREPAPLELAAADESQQQTSRATSQVPAATPSPPPSPAAGATRKSPLRCPSQRLNYDDQEMTQAPTPASNSKSSNKRPPLAPIDNISNTSSSNTSSSKRLCLTSS